MKILKWNSLVLIAIFAIQCNAIAETNFEGEHVSFKSANNINVTADIYESVNHDKDNSPIILLFHQAGYSRGEYRQIAPKLATMGYTCIAVDQRSGKAVNGVINETHLEAEKANLPTAYADAYPDLVATLDYAKKNYPNRKIIIWGSSYSSSLVFILGSNYAKDITGILSFSPGEYFEYNNKKIVDYAKEVKCPVFITSAKDEHKSWKAIYAAAPNPGKQFFLPVGHGFHGSKALWNEKPGNEEYWEAVIKFLESLN
jgi:dienelactone hydrolase